MNDETSMQSSETTPPEADGFDDFEPSVLGGDIPDDDEDFADDTEEGDEPPEADPGIPDSYELTAPEGLALDPAAIELATPVFRELGLSNEQANKLMPVAGQFAQGLLDRHNRQILGQVQADRKAWLDAAQADPEIGGRHWATTIGTAARALDALGLTRGSPFRVLLDESGLGNHPEMIRAFQRVGKAIGEDAFERSSGIHHAKRDRAETLYPEDKPKGG
ncbi:MAG: peptidase [Pseudomonadota bacterium]